MGKILNTIGMVSAILLPSALHAQDIKDLTVMTEIDSVYVFGFDLTESRSAKGGIWNLKTGRPETPQKYSQVQKDTLDGVPVLKLYREMALGPHPLNGWEIWKRQDGEWICVDDGAPVPEQCQ